MKSPPTLNQPLQLEWSFVKNNAEDSRNYFAWWCAAHWKSQRIFEIFAASPVAPSNYSPLHLLPISSENVCCSRIFIQDITFYCDLPLSNSVPPCNALCKNSYCFRLYQSKPFELLVLHTSSTHGSLQIALWHHVHAAVEIATGNLVVQSQPNVI